MAQWRVEIVGPLRVLKDGAPQKLRTLQQSLLLARLVAGGGDPVERWSVAELLWPEALPKNATAYLRRALMELIAAGLGIESVGSGLRLSADVETDVDLLSGSPAVANRLASGTELLAGLQHPAAETIRAIMGRRLGRTPSASIATPTSEEPGTRKARLEQWLGDALLRSSPDVAIELAAQGAETLMLETPYEDILAFFTRILAAAPDPSPARLLLLAHAGRVAYHLTRYGQAESLLLEAEARGRETGDLAVLALALPAISRLMTETRQWARGAEFARRAVKIAERHGDRKQISVAYNNLGGIQFDLLQFEDAVQSYGTSLRAAEDAPPLNRIVPLTNLATLWAIYGMDVSPPVPQFGDAQCHGGYAAAAEGHLQCMTGLGHGDLPGAVRGVLRILHIAAEDNLERLFAVAVDDATLAFIWAGYPEESAASYRIGSRLRVRISHPRSPAERFAGRRHLRPPLFGAGIAALIARWESDDLARIARNIGGRLAEVAVTPRRTG